MLKSDCKFSTKNSNNTKSDCKYDAETKSTSRNQNPKNESNFKTGNPRLIQSSYPSTEAQAFYWCIKKIITLIYPYLSKNVFGQTHEDPMSNVWISLTFWHLDTPFLKSKRLTFSQPSFLVNNESYLEKATSSDNDIISSEDYSILYHE